METRRHRPWRSIAVAFLAAAAPSAGRAQILLPLFPQSLVITNYDRLPVGAQEALEAGAYVARVGDSTSGWYNPAGLARVERTTIGASATGFESDIVSLEGLEKEGGGLSLYELPSFFGAVLGKDVLGSDRWRIGLSVTKPISWNQNIEAVAQGSLRVTYSSHVSFSTLVPAISASYAPADWIRVGAGVGMSITSLSEVRSLSVVGSTPAAAPGFLRALDGRGVVWNLTGDVGAQWDVTDHLVLGVMVRFPGLKVLDSGSLSYQNVANDGTPWGQVYFHDAQAAFDYRLPLDVNAGLAWHSTDFDLELDVRYHSAVPEYSLLSTQKSAQVTTTAPDGTPVVTLVPFPALRNSARQVWNGSVGGRAALGNGWSLHAGFYGDRSPTDPAGPSLFRAIDMYGATAGAELRDEHLSGSLGLGYTWGSSQTYQLSDPVTGALVSTRLLVTSLTLLYAFSYSF
jgi:hypothetical protein